MIEVVSVKNKVLNFAMRGQLTQNNPSERCCEKLIVKSKKTKNINTTDFPYILPDNWIWTRLGDISTKITDGSHNPPPAAISGYPVISAKNIENGKIVISNNERYANEEGFSKENKRTQISKNDVILGIIGGSIGNVALYDLEQKVIAQRSIAIIKTRINQKYVFYFLSSFLVQEILHKAETGSAQGGVYLDEIENFIIPVPPLEEQKRIVEKIESIFALLDEIDKAQEEYINNATKLNKMIIQEVVLGHIAKNNSYQISLPTTDSSLPKIPKDWKWLQLQTLGSKEELSFADGPFGSNLKKEHYTDKKEVRIIQLSNVGENGWKDGNEKYTSFEHLNEIKRSEVKPGNIVIAKMMPVGRAIIVPDLGTKFVLSSDCVKFVPQKQFSTKYLCYAINCDFFRKQLHSTIHGIGRERTSLSRLKKMLIPVPPIEEQKRIVEKLDSILPLCEI